MSSIVESKNSESLISFLLSYIYETVEHLWSFAKSSGKVLHTYFVSNFFSTVFAIVTAIVEGLTLGLLGVQLSVLFQYSLVTGGGDKKVMLEFAKGIFGSFLVSAVFGQFSSHVIELIAKNAETQIYNEIKDLVVEEKALIFEGKLIDKHAISIEYSKIIRVFGHEVLKTIKNLVSTVTIFWMNAAIMGTGVGVAAWFATQMYLISVGITWFGNFIQVSLLRHTTMLNKDIKEVEQQLSCEYNKRTQNSELYEQMQIKDAADNTITKLEHQLAYLKNKALPKNVFTRVVRNFSELLMVVSEVLPNIIAVAYNQLTLIQVVASICLSFIKNSLLRSQSNTTFSAGIDDSASYTQDCKEMNLIIALPFKGPLANKAEWEAELIDYDPNYLGATLHKGFAAVAPVKYDNARPTPKGLGRELYKIQEDIVLPERALIEVRADSGTGKTLLLNMIGNVNHMYNGKISMPSRYKTKTAFVGKPNWNNLPNCSLFDILTSKAKGYRDLKELEKEILELFNRLNLDDSVKEKLHSSKAPVSTGQTVRLLIIKAVIERSELMLLDEALAAVSNNHSSGTIDFTPVDEFSNTKDVVQAFLKEYAHGRYKEHKNGATIISIEHGAFDKNFVDHVLTIERKTSYIERAGIAAYIISSTYENIKNKQFIESMFQDFKGKPADYSNKDNVKEALINHFRAIEFDKIDCIRNMIKALGTTVLESYDIQNLNDGKVELTTSADYTPKHATRDFGCGTSDLPDSRVSPRAILGSLKVRLN